MSQDPIGSQAALKNLADLLRESQPETPKPPAVTDQHILKAMLGKPWGIGETLPQNARKAG
jgi:hypothetical protein